MTHPTGALKPLSLPWPFHRPRSVSTSTPPARRAIASIPLLFSYTFSLGATAAGSALMGAYGSYLRRRGATRERRAAYGARERET